MALLAAMPVKRLVARHDALATLKAHVKDPEQSVIEYINPGAATLPKWKVVYIEAVDPPWLRRLCGGLIGPRDAVVRMWLDTDLMSGSAGESDLDWIVGKFPELRSLSLRGSIWANGRSAFSDSALNECGKFRELRELELVHTSISDAGLSKCGTCDRLRKLNIFKSNVSGRDLAATAHWPKLEEVNLVSSPVESLTFLTDSPLIKTLDLRSTQVTDGCLTALSHMSLLENLLLSGTRVSDTGISGLPAYQSLAVILLSDTNIGDASCRALVNCPKLRWFAAKRTHVGDDGVRALARLTELQIIDVGESPGVTDLGLNQLVPMTSLKTVSVRGTAVTKAAVEAFRKSRPDVSVIFED